jgi:hypothetical protein
MTRRLLAIALLGLLATAPGATAAGPPPSIAIATSRVQVVTRVGDSFRFESAIANRGTAPVPGLIAHLNVVSLTRDVYVDPEDWSSARTQFLAPIPAGGSRTLSWNVKAVNGGDFAVYVVVLPSRPRQAAGRTLAASPAVAVHVAEHRTLSAGGALPIVLGVPGLLALLMIALRMRRRRLTRPA